jgi:hypothetical protein
MASGQPKTVDGQQIADSRILRFKKKKTIKMLIFTATHTLLVNIN